MNRSQLIFYILGKKYGFDLREFVRFVEENQYWDLKQIEEYQTMKMEKLVRHAYANTRHYKMLLDSLGLTPASFQNLSDLKKLPIIGKQDINPAWEAFLAQDILSYKPMERVTSGTTGVTFKYFNDVSSWGLNWATKIRTFGWGGYRFGVDKIAVLKGGSMLAKGKSSLKTKIWKQLHNYYDLPVIHLTPENMDKYYHQIQDNNIRYLRGFPTAVFSFAKYISGKYGKLPMKATFSSAEVLQDEQRALIQEVFGTKHIDAYGCGDGMGGANQCEKCNGYHINIETSYMEIIGDDGRDCSIGEQGEVILTSLNDYAMPLIRYSPGDFAVVGDDRCACGRSLKTLHKIAGRTSDIIELPNGRILNGISIPFADWADKIVKFQLVHSEPYKVELKVIPKPTLTKSDVEHIVRIMEYHLGNEISFAVNIVDDIPLTKSGKFRYVISLVKS